MGKGTGTSCQDRPSLILGETSTKEKTSPTKPILISKGKMRFPEGSELEEFDVKPKGDWFLITPKPNKFSWQKEERFWRSALLDKDGNILSVGFPKFGNYGERGFEDHLDVFESSIKSGKIWFAEKMDGSLAIRSVVDGKVLFRTRGSIDGIHSQAMYEVAQKKYPALLDPAFAPESSVLFEFVSPKPEFKIVLSYKEEDLIMLGGVNHSDLSLWTEHDLSAESEKHNLKKVETVEVPNNTEDLLNAVGSWSRREGVVARCNNGQVLVKVKSQSYLALHRLKSNLNAKAIRQQIEQNNIDSPQAFEEHLIKNGGDWEIVQDVQPYVKTYFQASQEAEQEFLQLRKEALEQAKKLENKKEFALQYAANLPSYKKGAAFSIYTKADKNALKLIRKHKIDEAFALFGQQEALLEEEL